VRNEVYKRKNIIIIQYVRKYEKEIFKRAKNLGILVTVYDMTMYMVLKPVDNAAQSMSE
jgi:hypothetical protein